MEEKRMYNPEDPLPQRDPMRSLADWGAPPDPPIEPDDSPGPPPWVASRPRGVPTWAVALIVLGVLALCVVGVVAMAVPMITQSPSVFPIETQSPTAKRLQTASAPAVNRIGQAVRAGDFQYTVYKVKCGIPKVGDQYLNKSAQGSFCRVDLTAKNVTRSAHTFHADSLIKAQDSTGREFSPDGEANIYGNKSSVGFLEEINPGNSVRVFVYFDVPKDAKLVRLELSAGLFTSAKDAVVELS